MPLTENNRNDNRMLAGAMVRGWGRACILARRLWSGGEGRLYCWRFLVSIVLIL